MAKAIVIIIKYAIKNIKILSPVFKTDCPYTFFIDINKYIINIKRVIKEVLVELQDPPFNNVQPNNNEPITKKKVCKFKM